jgi:hypothetical protein
MCGANIFPRILHLAGIPDALHARNDENDAVTLGSIFADRSEAEFLHAVATFERFEAGRPGTITRETTIGELRATTRAKITDENLHHLSLTGIPAEKAKAFLDTHSGTSP